MPEIKQKPMYIICILVVVISFIQVFIPSLIIADVPFPFIHKPSVPYHMQYINFQTIQLDIFGEYASGMISDPYTDLSWNPAFITRTQTAAYLKVNFNKTELTSPYYIDPDYSGSYAILPRWNSTSEINTLNTEPVYHIAFMKKISSKLCLGVINRSLVDYGAYRSTGWWDQRAWDKGVEYNSTPEPQTLEVDENIQKVWGNQMEIYLGYKLSNFLSAGFKFGHYLFRREGSLYDSKWGKHPHYSYADLNHESLDIKGDQIDLGIGLIYHFNKNSFLGIYGSYMSGSTTDIRAVEDTSDNWSENAEDTKYYDLQKYNLTRNEHNSSDDSQPLLSLVFEKKFSQNITLRSFLRSTWLNSDISGRVNSMDTTYADRTYDTYHDHFQHREYYLYSNANLQGTGKIRSHTVQWFTSIMYSPDKNWSLFSGIYFSRSFLERKISEDSDYLSRNYTEYTEYDPGSRRNFYSHEKQYSYELHSDRWSCIFPMGFRITILKGFDIIMGAHIRFSGYDIRERGSVLYPEKINKRWEDESLIVDDIEEDRYELYNSDPSFSLQRETDVHFGARYEHASGLRIFIRTEGNFSNTDLWALGFEMIF